MIIPSLFQDQRMVRRLTIVCLTSFILALAYDTLFTVFPVERKMMTEKPTPDPSMDEILASIRQIIAADSKEGDHHSLLHLNQDNEILDLTDLLPDELENLHASGVSPEAQLNDAREWSSPRYEENSFEEQEKYPQNTVSQPSPYTSVIHEEPFLSQGTVSETTQAFHLLNSVIQEHSSASTSHLPGNLQDQTLENVVRELLKPLLKEWLDAHLPSLVRSIVNQQIDNIVRQKGPIPCDEVKISAVRASN